MSESKTSSIPRKSYKRPYKKSTSGCTSCKTRKVKCDEARPICAQCRKRYIGQDHCVYDVKPLRTSIIRRIYNSSLELPKHVTAQPTGMANSNLLELRLMHHFTKTTRVHSSPAGSISMPWLRIWELDIPQIAFTSGPVLDALFSVSALDLSIRDPENKEMAMASRYYFSRALAKHRQSILQQSEEDSVPMLLAAILIAHHTWIAGHYGLSEERNHAQLNTFKMCEGIVALTEVNSKLSDFRFPRTASKYHSAFPVCEARFLQEALEDLNRLKSSADFAILTPEDSEAYDMSAQELIKIYCMTAEARTSTMIIEQAIVTFLHSVPRRFVDLIADCRPIALAIWLRDVILLDLFENSPSWWIQGSGTANVATRAFQDILSLMPPDCLWMMEWPARILSKDVRLGQDQNFLSAALNAAITMNHVTSNETTPER